MLAADCSVLVYGGASWGWPAGLNNRTATIFGGLPILTHTHTVDGRNPAPPKEPWNSLQVLSNNGHHGFKLVQDSVHSQYGCVPVLSFWQVGVGWGGVGWGTTFLLG